MKYVLILAGGEGKRLWPISRIKSPKQFHPLINQNSMLENTINRILPLVPKEHIYISTNKSQLKLLKKAIKGGDFNIIGEPEVKNTAPAIGLATKIIFEKDKEAKIAVLPSDHYIKKEEKFRELLELAYKEAEKEQIVILGIKPERPETGYGYIKLKNQKPKAKMIYEVEKFVEKPDLETAKKYLASGLYLWNAGMFIYKASYMLDEFKKHLPNTYKNLSYKDYHKTDDISIDYGIIEKTKSLVVIPADIGWSDIGSWASLYQVLAKKPGENIIRARHLDLGSCGCLIIGNKRLIATVGLKNTIIIDTKDALLVCDMNKAQDVKKVVEELKQKKQEKYL